MKTTQRKALHFLTALMDVYRCEEDRELNAFSRLDLDDFTDDFTALILAAHLLMQRVSDFDGDLIDFTHVLNKLAVQYVMDGQKEAPDEQED